MSYSLRYSPQALRDMDVVWSEVFEASLSIAVANRYVGDFIEKIAAKKDFPFTEIALMYRGLFTGYYSLNFKKYKAFYRVREDTVEIIRIIMMKRDYLKILFEEEKND